MSGFSVGYAASVEDDVELEDYFDFDEIEDETVDLSIMEHLLYAHYLEEDDDYERIKIVPYEREEWLDLWRKYSQLDEQNQAIWAFKNPIESWEQIDQIMNNIEELKSMDKELFEKVFTSNFITCFLYEIFAARDGINWRYEDKKKRQIVKWIRKNRVHELKQEDIWRVLKQFRLEAETYLPRIRFDDTLVRFSQVWRACGETPIHLSLNDDIQINTFRLHTEDMSKTIVFGVLEEEAVNMLLDFCDGIIHNRKQKNEAFLECLLSGGNKELLYRCLKKNVINQKTAKAGFGYAMEQKKYDVIPLLMLKTHGEWKEE